MFWSSVGGAHGSRCFGGSFGARFFWGVFGGFGGRFGELGLGWWVFGRGLVGRIGTIRFWFWRLIGRRRLCWISKATQIP